MDLCGGAERLKEQSIVSKATIDRLPLYFRTLRQIQKENVIIISSEELGRRIGVTPEQIRKDLSSFGEFGKKGVGYYVEYLVKHIGEILGLHREWNIAVIGFGHLGRALVNYKQFTNLGFNIKAIFDDAPAKIGEVVGNVEVRSLNDLKTEIADKNIHIGVIAVPSDAAQDVADLLISAGIRGIWNFAPVILNVPEGIRLRSEDLSVGLTGLSYYLTREIP
jgi:redox-sensing transcriptional repressor